MPTFKRCDDSVDEMAKELLSAFESHHPLRDARPRIDYVFAHADLDAEGFPKGHPLKLHGRTAYAIVRIISKKQRALGRGDAEVAIDGDWWRDATAGQRRAVLDHELHHLAPATDKLGLLMRDDLNRPRLRMREHDVQFGWFAIVASRHGDQSMEVMQAAQMWNGFGQAFWPAIFDGSTRKPVKAVS